MKHKRSDKARRYAVKIAQAKALEEDHTVTAASCYEQAFQMYPNRPGPLVKKVHMLWRCHQDSIDPRKEADRLVKLFPNLALSYEKRGRVLASYNMFAEAIADYDTALKMDPDNVDAYKGRGFSLIALGRYEEAAGMYGRAVQMRPDDDEAVAYLCSVLEDLRKYDDALAVLEAYLPHDDGRNYEVYRHIGRVHGLLGNVRASFANYARSVRLNDPGRGAGRRVKERYLEIEDVRRIIEEMDPSKPDSFFAAATTALLADWTRTARDMYKTGLLFAPNPRACMRVAEIGMYYMDYTQAIKYCKLALGMPGLTAKDLAAFHSMLVECLFKCGRFKEVLKYCGEAESLGVVNSDMKRYRSAVLKMGDDPADADQVSGGWTIRSDV